MKTIFVTDEGMRHIEAAAIYPFKNTSTRCDQGWQVRIDDETYDGLMHLQIPGETASDTIVRICRKNAGKKDN